MGGERRIEASGEAQLSSLFAAARAKWPAIDVGEKAFFEHVAGLVAGAEDSASAVSLLQGPDLYLALACAQGDPKALAEFDRLAIAEVPRWLTRFQPTPDLIAEVKQMLRERLLVATAKGRPRILDYSGRGALGAWVRIAAVRTALDLRRRKAEVPTPDGTPPEIAAGGPEVDVSVLRHRHRGDLKAAVEAALLSLPEAERSLLRAHVVEGLTVEQLGQREGVHGSTISRRITRIRTAVREETRRRLAERTRCSDSEFRSLVRILRTDLDVSIERVLGSRVAS